MSLEPPSNLSPGPLPPPIPTATTSGPLSPPYNSQLQELLGLELLYHPRRLNSKAPAFYPTRRRQLLYGKYANASAAMAEGRMPPSISSNYVLIRQKLLAKKFGPPTSVLSHLSLTQGLNAASSEQAMPSTKQLAPQPEEEATPAATETGVKPGSLLKKSTPKETYAFTGMAAFFDQHKQAVTKVKFANGNADMFACASMDGSLSICLASSQKIVYLLCGHEKGVTDFEWSMANHFLLSASLDQTVRLWDTKTGECVRVISETSEILCCAFCPVNNNLFVIGTRKDIKVYNLSTGKIVTNPTSATSTVGAVKTITFDSHGRLVFAGDEAGFVYTYDFTSTNGRIRRLSKMAVSSDKPITSLSFGEWSSRQRNEALLLVNSRDNYLRIMSLPRTGELKLRNSFLIQQQTSDLRSTFCPLLSVRSAPCVVTGTEDHAINIYDIHSRIMVNQLKGNSAPVLCVSWNFDESLLASADALGVVILWRRAADV